jgi:uncharacterized protein (TIGR03435 family)
MKILRLAMALLLASSASILLAQTPAPAKDALPPATEPLIVDAHASPYRATVWYRMNLGHQRFDMRDASILDLISFAFTRDDDAILGGPAWIDFDHFDIVASVPSLKLPSLKPDPANAAGPPPDPYDQVRPIIKRTLEERFHLKYHTEQRPLPGYIMTVAKDGVKMAEAKDPTADPNCHGEQDKATPGQYSATCTSETITQFLASFGGMYPHPVIDRTGLTKSYDFTLRFNFADLNTRDAYIRAYTDAFSKQLGLVVAPGDVPQPAIVVDSVDRPTPNPPDIAKLIPAMPDLEFEVATIKPAADTEPRTTMRFAGSQVTYGSYSVQEILVQAFQLPTGAMLGNAPPWLDHTRYTILVKLPPDMDARAVWQNQDQVDNMLQKLLVDRFQIKYHWGEQTQDGYVLLAGTPKMKKADPSSHSVCAFGPPPGEKDVRNNPDTSFDHEFYCQNVTMDQFVDVAQPLTGSDIKNRVANKTGLAGSYDFTVDYTSGRKLRTDAAAADAAAKQAGDDTAAPTGGLSVVDAFRKELGLRLEKQPGAYPALILDHIEQTPTAN